MLLISRRVIAAALLVLLSACVTTNAARLGTATEIRPLVLPANVALYRVASQVPRRYEEVALLNSTGDSGMTDEARMFESMKKKAGAMGANGVILHAVSEPGSGSKVAAAIFGVSAQRKGKALAIWIFPEGPEPAASSMIAPGQSPSPAPAAEECKSCARIGKNP